MSRPGPKAVVLARFVPGARAGAVVAGIRRTGRARFLGDSVAVEVAWTVLMRGPGIWFGSVPLVARHVELVAVGLVALSGVPAATASVRARLRRRRARSAARGAEVLVVLQ